MLRQQEVIADDKPNRSLADFVAPIDSGDHGLRRRIRGDGRHRRRRAGARITKPSTTTTRAIIVKALADRLAEAFAEYLHAQARAATGATARTSVDQRRSDRREVSRHPSGVRLSCLSRPQREGASCSSCSARARHRHGPHRIVRDDAGRVGQRAVLLASAGAATSTSSGSTPIRSPTTRSVWACPSRMRKSGCARCLATIQHPPCLPRRSFEEGAGGPGVLRVVGSRVSGRRFRSRSTECR